MIPQEIIDFIHRSQFGHVGSRDENMVPTLRRCWGATISDTREVMIVYVVQELYEQMLKNFNDNGQVALVLFEWPSHRTYQFKGQFLKTRQMTPDEVAFQRQFREKPMAFFREMGFSDEISERAIHFTDLAIEFKVEKVFDQTPGPGAGKAIELTL